jgi:hypothetical protein
LRALKLSIGLSERKLLEATSSDIWTEELLPKRGAKSLRSLGQNGLPAAGANSAAGSEEWLAELSPLP